MVINLMVFMLVITSIQDSQYRKVDRVFVVTPYNASIVFEYANLIIPEGKQLTDELVDCFVSKLKATGLFRDVHIKIKATEEGEKALIEVIPEWDQTIESFVINELVFEGVSESDQVALRQYLRKQGVRNGIRLFRYPLSKIKAMIRDAAQKISESNPEREEQIDLWNDGLSFELKVIAPRKVQLKIGSYSSMPCQ